MAVLELSSKDKAKPYVIVDDDLVDDLSQYRWTWSGGYASTRMQQPDGSIRYVRMHRYIVGASDGDVVDHINRVRYDNRRENLRLASSVENARNRSKSDVARSTSQYVGVSRNRSYSDTDMRWTSTILGQCLGVFDDEIEAAYVRDQAAMQIYGEFSFLNFDYEDSFDAAPSGQCTVTN